MVNRKAKPNRDHSTSSMKTSLKKANKYAPKLKFGVPMNRDEARQKLLQIMSEIGYDGKCFVKRLKRGCREKML